MVARGSAVATGLSGPQMLQALDDALRDVRREEDELTRRLARSVELTVKLRQTEGELMRRLAAATQDADRRAALSGSLTQAEVEARTLLEQHGSELESAGTALAELDQRIAGLESERASLRDTAHKARLSLAAIAERIEAAPATDSARLGAREAATAAQKVAAEAQRKARQAEAERGPKSRPFRDDLLFMYLWERGYGSPGYRHGGLTAQLDGWVARLIGFERARTIYLLAADLPARLNSFAEALRQRAEEAEAEVGRLERAAIDEAGGRSDRETVERAASRIAEIDAEVVLLEDQRDEAARRQRELAQGSEPPLSAALAALSGALERDDVKDLLRQARLDGSEGLVRQIDELRGRAGDEESDARDLRGRLRTLALRRRQIEDIRYELKRAGFDEPRSRFDEERLATDMLNDFLRGGIAASEYWSRLRRNQRWAEDRSAGKRKGFGWLGTTVDGGRATMNAAGDEGFSRPRNTDRPAPRAVSASA